jgi:flagellar hook protein FlgE
MPNFSIPLTGLDAESKALNTIANNLSNMNTTAFKSQRAEFANLFYQQIGATGAGNPIQMGAGTCVAATHTDFTQGTISSTGSSTDIALNGSGFFVVNHGGVMQYTRAGSFTLGADGTLTTQAGDAVLGFPAAAGAVNTNAPIAPITIPVGQVEQPKATTQFSMTANLDASAPLNTSFPSQITVYDSLGIAHTATVTYTRASNTDWNYSIGLPNAEFAGGACVPATGTLTFDSSGNLSQITTGGVTSAVGPGAGSSVPVSFAGLADGSANLAMQWNLLGSSGTPNISQVKADSAISATLQNGYTSGQYDGFNINSNGDVEVSFLNGQKLVVGRIALANVTNQQGLQVLGDGNYATTLASGAAVVGASGTAGLGSFQDGGLEGSNVNISAEFSNLIIAQRAFEANSKAVTTFDSVTQETIQMIH